MILGLFYPEYMAFFLFAVALDITSHYAHLYRYDALPLPFIPLTFSPSS
jgi:hypothetical protein